MLWSIITRQQCNVVQLKRITGAGPFRNLSKSSWSTEKADLCIIGGGPIGTEAARLASFIGIESTTVIDPRGCLLAAPTGYVSKVLLDISHKIAEGSRGSRYIWSYAEEALEKTANRALNLTRMNFANINGTMPNVVKGVAKFEGMDKNSTYIIEINNSKRKIIARTVLIATGSCSTRLPSLPWSSDNSFLYDSDSIKSIGRVPEHLVIQGGGVIGIEYAFIFRRLGAKVTVCLREDGVLEGKAVDSSISMAVGKRLVKAGVAVRYNDGDFESVVLPKCKESFGEVHLKNSNKKITCDAVLSALGRGGCAQCLNTEKAGLIDLTESGHILTDKDLRAVTKDGDLSRVFVAGDAVGKHATVKPAGLLSTGLVQAHLAVRAAFPIKWSQRFPAIGKRKVGTSFEKFPAIAIWLEDGVGFCGYTESNAIQKFGSESVGIAVVRYEESVKACVQPRPSDEFLKLIYNKKSGVILGVHIFGKDASEMVNHPAGFINREATIWDACHSVPPAVTYDEIFIKAAQKASCQIACF